MERYLKNTEFELSSFSFANIFVWKDFFDFEFEVMDDALCIFAKYEAGVFLYLPPLGRELNLKTIESCFEKMESVNKGNGVSRIENLDNTQISLFDPSIYSIYQKSTEYVYGRNDIVSLQGNKYKSQRHACNYFLSHYNYELIPFDSSLKEECLGLYDEWVESRWNISTDTAFQQMLQDNRRTHQVVFEHHSDLSLTGRVIRIDGKVRAYTFGHELKPDTFCVLLEVADVKYQGLPTFIFKSFCADSQVERFSFINVMDDFGLENIRRVKLSYHPCQMIPTYVVSKKGRNP